MRWCTLIYIACVVDLQCSNPDGKSHNPCTRWSNVMLHHSTTVVGLQAKLTINKDLIIDIVNMAFVWLTSKVLQTKIKNKNRNAMYIKMECCEFLFLMYVYTYKHLSI